MYVAKMHVDFWSSTLMGRIRYQLITEYQWFFVKYVWTLSRTSTAGNHLGTDLGSEKALPHRLLCGRLW